MQPSYIIAGVLAFIVLVVNTPSLTSWISSQFQSKPEPATNGQCVRTQYPVSIADVDKKVHTFTICPETAKQLHEDLGLQIEKVSK